MHPTRISDCGLASDWKAACVNPPLKLIAFEWNTPMLIDVLAELSAQHGWQTAYCVSYGLEQRVKSHFPSAVYHETFDARYGRPPAELANLSPIGIDQPTAEALGYAATIALKQMDRMEIMGGFPTHDRFIHFHRLASYWTAVFDRLQPDLLLMPTAPHVVYDYIAYAIARRRGIKTVMFEYVTTEGLLTAIDRFEDGIPPLTAAYRKLLEAPPSQSVILSDRLESYLRRLAGNYDGAIPAWTRYVRETADALRKAQVEADKAKAARDTEARRLAEQQAIAAEAARAAEAAAPLSRMLRIFGLQRVTPQAASAPKASLSPVAAAVGPTPPSVEGYYGGRFYIAGEAPADLARRAADYRRQHQDRLIQYYDKLAVIPDLSQPYIYVALHLQPERSTNPLGGVFDDQHTMVDMIASALPAGWRIYVKEHPSQFAPQFVSERGRWTTIYDAMRSIPNVSLVARDTPSFDLIDNARAVATITGTSSWEAIVRRIPTLVFGEPWYKGCPGSFTVRTHDDCEHALVRIAAGERPDPAATRLFVKAAEQTSFPGYITSDEAEIAGVDEATNVRQLTRAIAECYAASEVDSEGEPADHDRKALS